MSKCKDLRYARPRMKVFCRSGPQDDLFVARIHAIVQNDEPNHEVFKGDIVLRFETKLNREGYFDVIFVPDGQQRSGGWTECGHCIYPMTDKYKAIHKLEKKYAKT